jgi:ribonuclease HI
VAVSDAKQLHILHHIRVYSDGSLYKNGVGAAASLYVSSCLRKSLSLHLGSALQHTVYEAELVGILLGLHLLHSLSRQLCNPILCVDNQAAIRALLNQKPHPGHYLLDLLHDAASKLKSKECGKQSGIADNFLLQVVWTPGHEGIPENEHVDSLAKEVAQGFSSPGHSLPPSLRKPLPSSASAIKQHLLSSTSVSWKTSWKASPRYAKSKHYYPVPSNKHLASIS